MPQLNKGGKFVFGLSIIGNYNEIQIPEQTIIEYSITKDDKIIIFTGAKATRGFCVTSHALLSNSKLKHILDDCPALASYELHEGSFIRYKGRGYSWLTISPSGVIRLPQQTMEYLNLSAGDTLMNIRNNRLLYPQKVSCYVPQIAELMNHCDDLVKERAVNALGIIGRADYNLIKPYWGQLLTFANADNPKIRLAFIWASENIATNSPNEIGEYIHIFSNLLNDKDTKVRMEAPEIFRILGKRVPELVMPYIEKLTVLSENDSDRVVRIHAKGAIKATLSGKQ